MARKPNTETTLQAMEDDMVAAVVKETGFQPSLARLVVSPIIRHLAERYPGERIYVAAPKREYPVEDIRQAYHATGNREAVCERFGISKTKFYELLKIDEAA